MTYLTNLNSFYNLSSNRKTRLLLSTDIIISKRTMMSTLAKIGGSTVRGMMGRNPSVSTGTQTAIARPGAKTVQERDMACYLAFKAKTSAAKKFATDQGTGHTMQNKIACTESDCETKVCKQPCAEIQYAEPKGHFTHNPPTNSTSVQVSTTDIAGKNKPQYFVKPPVKPTMSVNDLKNMTEDDMPINHQANNFFHSSQDIIDKITK